MSGPSWSVPAEAPAAPAAPAAAARAATEYGDAPVDSGITQIQDHADQAVALLPTAHTRTRWTALMRALLGRRGAWADELTLYVVAADSTSPTMPAFACTATQLTEVFGAGGAATVVAGRTLLQAAPSDALGDVTLYLYDGAAVALDLSADAVRAMFPTHELYELPDDLTDAQTIAVVEAGLGHAPSGLQELEGILWQTLLLTRLSLAYGNQLDALGDVLGLTRNGLADADYRDALAFQAALNASTGTVEEIIGAAASLDDVVEAQLLECFPATMTLYLHGTALTEGLRASLRGMAREAIDLCIVSAGGENPAVFGPEIGRHEVVSISGAAVTVLGDVTALFSAGDRVRLYAVASDTVAMDNATVYSVAPSGANTLVTLTETYGGAAVSATNPVILETMTGPQDPDGDGCEDAYEITGITQATKTITVSGDCESEWTEGQRLQIIGSTGNDEYYSVVSATCTSPLAGTEIVVGEALPDATGDGQLIHASPERAYSQRATLAEDGEDSPHGELAEYFRR